MGDFPSQVNVQPAPAVAGDFCNTNPRNTVDAGPGGLVAGPAGVTIGLFAWLANSFFDVNSAPQVANNFGTGLPAGFVHREQQGLITQYLQASGTLIPAGFMVTLFASGGFWVANAGTNEVVPGMKAYAAFATGAITFAATGTPTTGSFTGSIGAATASFTGSISGNVLTVTAVSAGTLVAGASLSGGSGIVATSQITAQLTGTTGGIGTYQVNIAEQTVPAAALTATYGILTVTGTVTGGTLGVGQTLTGSGVAANSYITQLGTGAGGAGTYYVSPTQTVGSITTTFAANIETKWFARSGGLPGELIKMDSASYG